MQCRGASQVPTLKRAAHVGHANWGQAALRLVPVQEDADRLQQPDANSHLHNAELSIAKTQASSSTLEAKQAIQLSFGHVV